MPAGQVAAITGRYPGAHGGPVHWGDPTELGLAAGAKTPANPIRCVICRFMHFPSFSSVSIGFAGVFTRGVFLFLNDSPSLPRRFLVHPYLIAALPSLSHHCLVIADKSLPHRCLIAASPHLCPITASSSLFHRCRSSLFHRCLIRPPPSAADALASPRWGEAVELKDGEVPVFWACGVTPQSAIMQVLDRPTPSPDPTPTQRQFTANQRHVAAFAVSRPNAVSDRIVLFSLS